MTPQRINLALWTLAAAAASATPVALWAGLLSPLDSPTVAPVPLAARTAATAPSAGVPTVASFGDTLARAYRPALTGSAVAAAPAAVDAAPPPPPATARLQLVGTVGDAVALIRGPDGTTAMVEVGDDVDGAAVVAIGPSRVDLRQNGRPVLLRKPTPPPATGDIVVH